MSRRRWVVNASPLIFLGKVDALPLLEQLAEEVVMPFSVHREVLAKTKDVSSSPLVVLPRWLIRQDDLPLPPEIAGWDLGIVPAAKPLIEELLSKGLYLSPGLVHQALRDVGE